MSWPRRVTRPIPGDFTTFKPLTLRRTSPRPLEAHGGGSFRFERGDSFDETGDGECVADATLTADKMQSTALAGEGNGKFHESGNAGAVDLRNVVQVDDKLSAAALHQILGELGQVLAGFADGETAVNLQVVDAAGLARRNFQWWMKRHEISPQFDVAGCPPQQRHGDVCGICIIR